MVRVEAEAKRGDARTPRRAGIVCLGIEVTPRPPRLKAGEATLVQATPRPNSQSGVLADKQSSNSPPSDDMNLCVLSALRGEVRRSVATEGTENTEKSGHRGVLSGKARPWDHSASRRSVLGGYRASSCPLGGEIPSRSSKAIPDFLSSLMIALVRKAAPIAKCKCGS